MVFELCDYIQTTKVLRSWQGKIHEVICSAFSWACLQAEIHTLEFKQQKLTPADLPQNRDCHLPSKSQSRQTKKSNKPGSGVLCSSQSYELMYLTRRFEGKPLGDYNVAAEKLKANTTNVSA